MAYDTKDHAEALRVYEQLSRNMAATARQTGVSKPTLYGWKKEGLPAEVTGGVDWDDYLDSRVRAEVQRKRVEALDVEREWLDQRKMQIDQMLDKIYDRTILGEGVEIKPEQFDKLMRLKILLDNMEQDKLEFMQLFVAKVMQIVAEVLDTGSTEWVQIKSRVMNLQKSEKDKLDLLPARFNSTT